MIGVGFVVLNDGWILTMVMRCKGQLFVVFIQVKDCLYRLKRGLEQIQGKKLRVGEEFAIYLKSVS